MVIETTNTESSLALVNNNMISNMQLREVFPRVNGVYL